MNMRTVSKYTEAIKSTVLSKILLSKAPNVLKLSKEFNIPYSTIYTWMHNMHKHTGSNISKSGRPRDKSSADKLKAVIDTIGKTDEELGAYCREQGLYPNHIDSWKQQMLSGLSANTQKACDTKESKSTNKAMLQELAQLKAALNRKNQALAELTALLVLKKKADSLW